MRTYTLEVTTSPHDTKTVELNALNNMDAITQARAGIPLRTVRVVAVRDVGEPSPPKTRILKRGRRGKHTISVTPGKRCPATRSNKAHDPSVKVTGITLSRRTGVRKCGVCGNEAPVSQAIEYPSGAPLQAWQYDGHLA